MNSHELARTLLAGPDRAVMLHGAYGKTQPLADVIVESGAFLTVVLRVTQAARPRDASCGWGHGDRCPCNV